MKSLGDFDASAVVYGKFSTFRPSTGAAFTLAGSPALSVYKDASTTQSTTGVTLTADFDSVTGFNHFAIDTSADGTFYSAGSFFDVVVTTGTVDSISVVGAVVGSFTIRKNSAIKPTTAGRTLDVSSGGEAGLDWANIGSPTTSNALTGTTIATTQKVDLETIKTNPVVNAGTVTFPTTATLASTSNITAGTITTATNLTNAPTVGDLTSTMKTSIGTAVAASAVASVTGNVGGNVTGSVGSVSGSVGSVSGAVGSVSGAVGSVTGNVGGNVTGSVGSVAAGGITSASFGSGATIPRVTLADTLTTYTSNTPQTGDSFAVVNSGTSGNAALKLLIDAIDDYVDTEVAAIKSKTDNLPSDPADASDVAASFSSVASTLTTIASYIDTEVAAIKAKTDNLPASPAAVGSAMTLTGAYDAAKTASQAGDAMTLTSGERTTLTGVIWAALLSGITTVGSVGKLIKDNIDAVLSTIASSASSAASSAATAATNASTAASNASSAATNASTAATNASTAATVANSINTKIGTPASSVSADIAAAKVDTAAIKVKTDQLAFTSGRVNADATVTLSEDDITAIADGVAAQVSGGDESDQRPVADEFTVILPKRSSGTVIATIPARLQAGEEVLLALDFINLLSPGDRLTSVSSVSTMSDEDITLTAGGPDRTLAKVGVSGGVAGITYLISATVSTALGDVIRGEFRVIYST